MKDSLRPRESSANHSDLFTLVFYLKHQDLTEDLTIHHVNRQIEAHVESVERQKRGLPHTHLHFWVSPADEPLTKEKIDSVISAEI